MIPQEYFTRVKKHFNGDTDRTWKWFREINPSFGMLSPLNMLKLGRSARVQEFIEKEM